MPSYEITNHKYKTEILKLNEFYQYYKYFHHSVIKHLHQFVPKSPVNNHEDFEKTMKGLKNCVSKADIQFMNEYLLLLNKMDKKLKHGYFKYCDDINDKRMFRFEYVYPDSKMWTNKNFESIIYYLILYPHLMCPREIKYFIKMVLYR
jgi:hypothetical protein